MLKRSLSDASKNSNSVNGSFRRRSSKQSNHIAEEVTQDKTENEEDVDRLIEAENAAVGNVSFDVYLRYFKSVGSGFIIIILLFTLSSEASSVLSNCNEILSPTSSSIKLTNNLFNSQFG